MEWHSEFQARPVPIDAQTKTARSLCLLYYVRTEENDRSYPHVIRHGVAFVKPECREFSLAEARREHQAFSELMDGTPREVTEAVREWVQVLSFDGQRLALRECQDDLREAYLRRVRIQAGTAQTVRIAPSRAER